MNLVDNNFKSSYNHSFGRRNIVNYPHNIYVNKEVKKNLKIPIFREKYLSTYETSFRYKKQEGVNHYQRTSVKENLKRLHEEYLGNPVKPHGTTTGTRDRKLKLPFFTSFERHQLPKNVDCSIKLRDNDKFTIPINENNFQKLLDIYSTTSQLTHIDFFRNEKNIISQKFNNDIDSKNRRKSHFYFCPKEKTFYRQLPKQFSQLPYSGNINSFV
ncbi:uncharacterized protein LOC127283824 [Leptopilina boulardi]|uniref:uncharacterized protein LOC127283824 n=1 Tax=Leptopilina boulardi TaxID=63433 RepID=UPI0021F5ACEA|nr:uncharacterized protein LOC127283824 [Leptopilina boulardi]